MSRGEFDYQSPRWRALSARVKRRDGYTCTKCGATNTRLIADHIQTVRERPDLAWDERNVRTLCAACDNKRHNDRGNQYPDNPLRGGCGLDGMPLNPKHPWRQ